MLSLIVILMDIAIYGFFLWAIVRKPKAKHWWYFKGYHYYTSSRETKRGWEHWCSVHQQWERCKRIKNRTWRQAHSQLYDLNTGAIAPFLREVERLENERIK